MFEKIQNVVRLSGGRFHHGIDSSIRHLLLSAAYILVSDLSLILNHAASTRGSLDVDKSFVQT